MRQSFSVPTLGRELMALDIEEDENTIEPPPPTNTRPASDRQLALLIGLLVFFIVSMAITFGYVGSHAKHDKEYLALAGQQRVLTLHMVKTASEATMAKVPAFTQLQEQRDRYEEALSRLTDGNQDTGLPPSPPDVTTELSAVQKKWGEYRRDIDVILKSEGVIRMLSEFVKAINDVMPDLLKVSEEVSGSMIASGTNARDIYIASRQLMLGQRIATNVNRMLQGGAQASEAADAFQRDTQQFESVLKSMLHGDQHRGLTRIDDSEARRKLQSVEALFETVRELVSRILEKAPELYQAQKASANLFSSVDPLLERTDQLVDAYADLEKRRAVTSWTGYGLGALALAVLLWLGFAVLRNTRIRFEQTAAVSDRQQEAILQLLNEIGTLGEGDLTVRATVTPEITGAIAEAVNYTVDALRKLVRAIDETAVEVSSAAEETQATAIHLAKASERQASQITLVTSSVNEMAGTVEEVSEHAARSAEVAQRAVAIANHGAKAVRNTIDGMNTIREHIQDTSKRVKRLGESSQEIGDIIELINDIADQTNILALNAAIQATAAGEAGQGFATVADEVQQLAERSGEATRRVESLVKAIQMDTNEAVVSMEQSTEQVVKGTKLAEGAGTALMEILEVSSYLADLIQHISGAATQQATAATSVSRSMNAIKNVTSQNLAGTKQTAVLTENLTRQAKALRKMVSGFKLP